MDAEMIDLMLCHACLKFKTYYLLSRNIQNKELIILIHDYTLPKLSNKNILRERLIYPKNKIAHN